MRASTSWALAKDHAKTTQRMIPVIIVESASRRAGARYILLPDKRSRSHKG
jgi:hypothetical protein